MRAGRAMIRRAAMCGARRGAAACPNLFSDLNGKVIVNAGAGNPPEEEDGLGAMTSLALARQGAKVVSVSNVGLNCETVTKKIIAEGGEGLAVEADCCSTEGVDKIVKAAMEKYGKVDVLINSGIHMAVPMGMKRMTPERWHQGIDINLNAQFNLIHGFLPTFQEQGRGNIIHFTTFGSALALGNSHPQRHSYFAGKAAAACLTRRIGIEFAAKNIRANVLSIGYCSGPLITRAVQSVNADMDAVNKKRDANVPRQYQLVPTEVANCAVFLASDMSSGVNAAELFVDGGGTACTYGP